MSAGNNPEDQKENTLAVDVQAAQKPASDKDSFQLGSLFNAKYRILKLLGQGGMSSVYQVDDIVLKRTVALKVLHPRYLNSDKAVLRFQQEARAASMLKHSSIVTIYEFGVSADGQPFLVMDYVDGVSLAEEIARSGPLPLPRMVKIVSAVCEALAEAHRQGIVHRDIKPSNIMLTPGIDGGDSVKIVDFGIAKLAMEDMAEHLTQTGEVFGSPMYMSPEQCQGLTVDNRADIYSLGCVLYQGLSGHPPFACDNALATMQQHINAELPPITEIREADSKQISQVQKILLGLLAKDPDQRYQNVQAILDDLAELLAGRSVKVNIPPHHGQRRRLTPVFLALSIALLVGAWQISSHSAKQSGSTEPGSTLPKEGATSPNEPAVQVPDEQLRQIWMAEDIAGQKDFDQGKLQSAKKHFEKALDVAKLYGSQDKELILSIAIGELCDLSAVMHDKRALEEYLTAEKRLQEGLLQVRLQRMMPLLQQLKKGIARKGVITHSERAQIDGVILCANDFADECHEGAYLDLQQEFSKYILAASEANHNDDQAARVCVEVGKLLSRRGNEAPAKLLLERGLAMRKRCSPPFDPNLGRAYSTLGRAQVLWNAPGALENLMSAYRIYSNAYGSTSSYVGSVASAIGHCYKKKNDNVQMLHFSEVAVQNLRNVKSSNFNFMGLMGDLGESYMRLNKPADACVAFQHSVDQAEARLDGRFFYVMDNLPELRDAKNKLGKSAEARALTARINAMDWHLCFVQRYLLRQTLAAFK